VSAGQEALDAKNRDIVTGALEELFDGALYFATAGMPGEPRDHADVFVSPQWREALRSRADRLIETIRELEEYHDDFGFR
jgi:hypothetical protein